MALSHAAAFLILVAAPGDGPPSYDEVPDIARAAITRRLDQAEVQLQSVHVKPSDTMPGFVACGIASEVFADKSRSRRERFFVIVPGDFAILDRDGKELVDHYWSLNRC
jgi:hypothetical protein